MLQLLTKIKNKSMNTLVQNNNLISCELTAVEMENINGGIDPMKNVCNSLVTKQVNAFALGNVVAGIQYADLWIELGCLDYLN
jgi:hypothetical protein